VCRLCRWNVDTIMSAGVESRVSYLKETPTPGSILDFCAILLKSIWLFVQFILQLKLCLYTIVHLLLEELRISTHHQVHSHYVTISRRVRVGVWFWFWSRSWVQVFRVRVRVGEPQRIKDSTFLMVVSMVCIVYRTKTQS